MQRYTFSPSSLTTPTKLQWNGGSTDRQPPFPHLATVPTDEPPQPPEGTPLPEGPPATEEPPLPEGLNVPEGPPPPKGPPPTLPPVGPPPPRASIV